RARKAFVDIDGVTQPGPAPRFSRTPGEIAGSPPANGEHTLSVLSTAGFSQREIAGLKAQDVV
ncbi:MAG: CoA transferase, partial [Woeseiaceae bacterium]